jgi:hypothetical protein
MLNKLVAKLLKRNQVQPAKEEPNKYLADGYKACVDRVLFRGHYLDESNRQVIVSQSERESEVLPKGIFLAELYTPCNDWVTPLVGTYSEERINAYSIGTGYGPGLGIPAHLKHRILAKELDGESHIVSGRFTNFDEVMDFLKIEPKNSYHLAMQEDGFWRGKHTYYGFAMIGGSINTGFSETEIQLTPTRKTD